MGCHKPKKNKINEEGQMQIKLPGRGNCHPIEEINLQGNNISDVGPGTFSGLQNLHRVNLMNNVRKTVPRDSLEISNLEASFLLSNNTFKCDCPLECIVSTPLLLLVPV